MLTPAQEPPEDRPLPPSQRPILRPEDRRGHLRFTLIACGVILLLILIRVATTHALPAPSHASPAGAVAGYLQGVEHREPELVRDYLAPSDRGRAASMLHALAKADAYIVSPASNGVYQDGRRATVDVSVQVCTPLGDHQGDSCRSLSQSPLDLPQDLECVERGGRWYVTTLFMPR